ncbi:putative cell wall glycosyl hydrolase YteR [Tricharina praecox]|uniref:putative cell wall glycosyl hydrolase YteR n=1 Tax=Tricharina praecox TaxID=43433 RepID=UPI00221F9519|nr:putative cell wall glycosyl hydrolase YteR [Tricharina praecox]KAI5853682.1 putative cell wall glycosyl hydrolase YteR [Tricharina praecox]
MMLSRSFTALSLLWLQLQSATAATPYSQLMLDSVIARSTPLGLNAAGKVTTTYEHGVIERALQMVYNVTGDSKYYNYQKKGVDNIIDSNGKLLDYDLTVYTLDDMRLGQEFLHLYRMTGQAKYKNAADTLRKQINVQPRNSEGGYWHRNVYPNQMWLDGQYMLNPFYAEYTSIFQPTNTTAWNDILLQYQLIHAHTLNTTSGLLAHGYDGGKTASWADPVTGAAPHVWIRALGWYTMSLLDVLDYFPPSHAGFAELKGYFTSCMEAVRAAADPATGGWWLVMDQPGRDKNYIESSGTAMFVYSFLKGLRVGYLTGASGKDLAAAEKAYQYMVKQFVKVAANGTADWLGTVEVGSLGGKADYDYYVNVALRTNDLKGIGPFVYASVEYERL